MQKKIFIFCLGVCLLLLSGCEENKAKINPFTTDDTKTNVMEEFKTEMKITINDEILAATLEDNETVRELFKRLPFEVTMQELNGNEKYSYLTESLPTKAISPKYIEAGDIMLYGDNCLVIFYKSFTTNYSYTKIGHITDLPDLGAIDATVKFEKE